ncbi:SRPBCC family protein [Halomonas caseinilytica]|uniref:Polyketide cyclase / dehydrase and lipid transport n=1 Tax=Halomonas caseinilytica TaxID=438744 RepID=A0A1M6NTI8_9GAMM|nr:SRPBCC family protein [Halomonas caseinilytica]SEM26770.1 Polyketide cyclase / dehydrase and lipid transport [Halomonas caseinilytica]SHJ99053.1 Polyketide cyclase / dehydrase and lipid transport [Halomonas caseinilytica]
MSTIEHSAILEAPPERVFALLERVEDFVDYSDLIKAIEPLGEDRYRWHVKAVGMDWTFDVVITESVAPEVLAWESVDGVSNRGRYHLTPVPEGTEVSLSLEYEIRNRLVEKAVRRAASPLVSRVSQQILDRVAARLGSTA